MSIPDYQSIMLPLLKFAGDEKEHSLRDAIDHICRTFKVDQKARRERLPSGQQPIIDNRVGWARTYLKKAGLLESPRKGYFRITDRGLKVLEENPAKVNRKYLMHFPEFVDFQTRKKERKPLEKNIGVLETLDPTELLDSAYKQLETGLSSDLLEEVKKSSPAFFENLVIDLLYKMGYGGSREDAAESVVRTGDEGIDGKIKEDRLGLDTIYLQAKRWKEGSVGRPEIQKFVGALKGQGANKGVFITTSQFSKEAEDYAKKIESPKIVLIDGEKLTELMIEYDLGVSEVTNYKVKRLDSDYFSEG